MHGQRIPQPGPTRRSQKQQPTLPHPQYYPQGMIQYQAQQEPRLSPDPPPSGPCDAGGKQGESHDFGLKKWIAAALDSLDGAGGERFSTTTTTSQAVSSGPYLNGALKIAHSLAEQVCKLDEHDETVQEGGRQEGGKELEEGGASAAANRSHLPSQGLQWSDFVTVRLDKSQGGESRNSSARSDDWKDDDNLGDVLSSPAVGPIGGQPEPLPPTLLKDLLPDDGRREAKVDKMHDAFEGIFHPVQDPPPLPSVAQSNRRAHANSLNSVDLFPEMLAGLHEEPNNVDYLSISGALFSPDSSDHAIHRHTQGDRTHIYYLGLVFFELFSGGQRPFAIEGLEEDPLAHSVQNWTHASEVGDAKSIIDAIGDDDELFGGMNLEESDRSADLREIDSKDAGAFIDDTRSKKRSHHAGHVPIETLKLLGLPSTLCNMIGNMIDCSSGDFSADETYSRMTDVRNDLKLLLESPEVYLCDIDLDVACKVGLQMNDQAASWYGRDEEFASLKTAYQRSMSNKPEAVIISGQPGIGKSSLAKEFAQYATSKDGGSRILLEGKFDKYHHSHFFFPIASALDKHCEWLKSDAGSKEVTEKVAKALKTSLGQEVLILSKLIPNIPLTGDETPLSEDEKGDVEDEQKRLRYLFTRFVEVVSQAQPLVLFLDDLQFASSASIGLIEHILLGSGSRSADSESHFFFLGCCNEMGRDIPLWAMLDSIGDWVETTKIELSCLDKHELNLMLSGTLNLLPRLTMPLTEIVYRCTKGNQYFVKQFMIQLNKENMLRPCLERRRWIWDEEKILECEPSDDVVMFLTASLNRLPGEVLTAMCTLSCFGSCSDRSLVQLGLSADLLSHLDEAVEEGFLKKAGGEYSFVDSRVQEATYNLMKSEERCEIEQSFDFHF
ncbi:hypothetical protein ACHAWF_015153 [Thalassiosira exigua]